MFALAATNVFTGSELLGAATVCIDAGRILEVRLGVSPGAQHFEGVLAPGLIDVQVNGGGGVMFNDDPTVQTLQTITQAHAQFGVTAIMATLISDERNKISAALAAVEQGVRQDMPGLLGLHLEGPWLSRLRRGVHPEGFLRRLDAEDLFLLTQKRRFPVIVTLAPEQASPADVRELTAAGVTVSIGHTAAPHEEIEALLAAGAKGFTHLFNAMAPLEGRKPGAVGVALANPDAWAGLILDGHHVHPISARAALAAKSARKLMLVSDAMATVGSANASMRFFDETIAPSGGALRTSSGALAGAHLDLSRAVRNAVEMMATTIEDALRMASLTPAQYLGLEGHRGRIAVGGRADMVAFGSSLDVRSVWVSGLQVR